MRQRQTDGVRVRRNERHIQTETERQTEGV